MTMVKLKSADELWLMELWQSLVHRVNRRFDHTAPTPDAFGSPALDEDARDTGTLTTWPSGSVVRPEPIMASEELQAACRRNLDEAISQYLRVMYGASSLLTDWALVAETVESSLDKDADEHMLWLGTSAGLSSWRLAGLAVAFNRLAYAGMAS